jgi:hypothetical protein
MDKFEQQKLSIKAIARTHVVEEQEEMNKFQQKKSTQTQKQKRIIWKK